MRSDVDTAEVRVCATHDFDAMLLTCCQAREGLLRCGGYSAVNGDVVDDDS